jgi:hypothetical protein
MDSWTAFSPMNENSDTLRVPTPALPVQGDVEVIVKQLEKEFAPPILADDPIRLYLRGFELTMHVGLCESARVIQDSLQQALAKMNTTLDAASAEKLKVLNDELIRYCEKAVKGITEGRNQANAYLLTTLIEMKSLTDQMKEVWRGNLWRERVVGVIIAAALFIAGYSAGYLFGHLRW